MGSQCQNSAVVIGRMGGLSMQIARGCGAEGGCAEIWECACLKSGHVEGLLKK